MKIETGISNYNAYEYRGSFEIVDRVKKPEDFYDESFLEEMSKQISPLIAKRIGLTVSQLKKKQVFLESTQYLPIESDCCYQGNLYITFELFIMNFGASLYIVCSDEKSNGIPPNPRKPANKNGLKFELLDSASTELKQVLFAHLLYRAKDNPERLEKDRQLYDKFLKSYDFQDWASYFRDLLGLTNAPQAKEASPYSFDYSLECGWPDVQIKIYFNEKPSKNTMELFEQHLEDFITGWNTKQAELNSDEFIHDWMPIKRGAKNALLCDVDLGNSDPENVIDALLASIDKSNMPGILKIVFA